jgi:integrating conjugative element protein (TIGR03756 family)
MRSSFRRRLGAALLALALLAPAPSLARPLTTPEILAETLAAVPACMEWFWIGLCIWLTCSPGGCVITFSPKVGHFNPDLVISAYHKPGVNPWVEMAALYGLPQVLAGQSVLSAAGALVPLGGGIRPNARMLRDEHEDLRFKEADAIGSPAAALADFLSEAQLEEFFLICPSEAEALFPYLLSSADALAWRLALPEMVFPQALIPGLREIGHWPINTWAAVYPRHGFVMQSHDTKAGAVCAQRAGDIVTRPGQPHVYTPVQATAKPSRLMVFPPPPLLETLCATGWFQMHSPVPIPACEVFGQADTLLPLSWGDFRTDTFADYAWTLWRPYECCKRRGEYLGSLEWMLWPPCLAFSF